MTSSAFACDLTLVLVSMLNICSVRPAAHAIVSLPAPQSYAKARCGRVTHTFKSQNLLVGVHYRGVCGDWSTQNIIGVVQVDDNDLVLLVDLLPHTDEMVGFEGQCLPRVGVNQRL